jgi:hypothetical protein
MTVQMANDLDSPLLTFLSNLHLGFAGESWRTSKSRGKFLREGNRLQDEIQNLSAPSSDLGG